MLSWLEKRLQLKDFFTKPIISRGMTSWKYFPGFFSIILLTAQTIIIPLLAIYPKSYIENLYMWVSSALVFTIFLHFGSCLYRGMYSKPFELVWVSMILLGISILANYYIGVILATKKEKQLLLILHVSIMPLITFFLLCLHLWLRCRVQKWIDKNRTEPHFIQKTPEKKSN